MTSIPKISIKLFCIFLFIAYACDTQNKKQEVKVERGAYDFEILYTYQGTEIIKEDKYRFKYPSDSLFIFFETEFIKDTLTLEENGKIIYSHLDLNTDPVTGIARVVVRKNIEYINHLGIRINNGPLIYIELIDTKNNILGVRNEKGKIEVVFYKKAPIFY